MKETFKKLYKATNTREKIQKITHTSALTFFLRDVEGPGELVAVTAVVLGGSITIWPVMDDRELLVCLPGSFVDVGGILADKWSLVLMKSKLECKMFSLFDKQFSGFCVKSSSTTLSKLKLKDLRSHDDDRVDVEEDDDDLRNKQRFINCALRIVLFA